MSKGLKISILLLSALAAVPWSAYVLTKLWAWFIVPIGAPAISLWQAAGISLVASFLTMNVRGKLDEDDYAHGAVKVWVAPAMALGIGAFYAWMAA